MLARAALIMIATLAGCGREQAGPAASAPAASAEHGPRIVCLSPASTLQIVQLGAADRLVGVTAFDEPSLPEEYRGLPAVGDYYNVNFESLLRLKPTAMIVQKADDRLWPHLKEFARQHQVELVNVRLDTLDDLFATARRVGQVCGKAQAAEYKVRLMQAQIQALREKTAVLPHPKVLYIIGKNPIWVVGANRIWNDIVTMAGGVNLGASLGSDFPEISREGIVRLAPEALLLGDPGAPPARDLDDPRLKMWLDISCPASQNGRIYLMTSATSQLASFTVPEEALELAQMLHPELRNWALPTEIPLATQPSTSPQGERP